MRTRRTLILLISGLAGAGKTTVSDLIKKQINDRYPELKVVTYSLSNPIKYIAQAFMDWDKEKDYKGRRLLQQIGFVGREYDEEIWVKHLLNQLDRNFGDISRIYPVNVVLIDDWRFPNELEALRKNPLLDVVSIRIMYRGGLRDESALDVSETSLPEDESHYDFVIDNGSSLESLTEKVGVLLEKIEKQYIVE